VGARLGELEVHPGDCVQLRAEGSTETWVAIIEEFTEDNDGEKAASFVWFSDEKEIHNKAKRRVDFLPVRPNFE
jgi:origin recognition complex subunit 1